jgi:hypothetical protein
LDLPHRAIVALALVARDACSVSRGRVNAQTDAESSTLTLTDRLIFRTVQNSCLAVWRHRQRSFARLADNNPYAVIETALVEWLIQQRP